MAAPAALAASNKIPWDLKALMRPPAWKPAEEERSDGVKGLFYDSVPWKGKPTRVFAWYGVPEGKSKAPAMVLIHGGGGTAFAEWVRLWNGRGYAAIAMDTCGATNGKPDPKQPLYQFEKPRHATGGPPGWGGFDQIDQAPEDQWTYHAVSAAILAHSLVRSFPEVDPKRVGLTGISWGGYLTSIVASLDSRFRFAAPVYGCGFLGDDSFWVPTFAKMGAEKARRWFDLWDPSRYLARAHCPMLWVNGTNDFAYPLSSYQRSYRLPRGPRTLSIRVRMPHGHPPGMTPKEIHTFAESVLNKGLPLTRIRSSGVAGNEAWARFESKRLIVKAELNFTSQSGSWPHRRWETAAGGLENGRASAPIPPSATAFYLNLVDDSGMVVSTEHVARA